MKSVFNDELQHHGILGQKWGIRRFQNADGSLTEEGKKRYDSNKIRRNARNLRNDLNTIDKEKVFARSDVKSAEKKYNKAKEKAESNRTSKKRYERLAEKASIRKEELSDARKKYAEIEQAGKNLYNRVANDNRYTLNSKEVSRFASRGAQAAIGTGSATGGLIGGLAALAGVATVQKIRGVGLYDSGTQYSVKANKRNG